MSRPFEHIAEQQAMPDGWPVTIELDLVLVHIGGLIVSGLLSALILEISPTARPALFTGLVFVVAFLTTGIVLHYIRYVWGQVMLGRAWREWDRGIRGSHPRMLSSDRDFLLQFAIALPIAIWFTLNVPIAG